MRRVSNSTLNPIFLGESVLPGKPEEPDRSAPPLAIFLVALVVSSLPQKSRGGTPSLRYMHSPLRRGFFFAISSLPRGAVEGSLDVVVETR